MSGSERPLLTLLSNIAKSTQPLRHLVKTGWQSYLHLLGWSGASLRVLGSIFFRPLPLETLPMALKHVCGFSVRSVWHIVKTVAAHQCAVCIAQCQGHADIVLQGLAWECIKPKEPSLACSHPYCLLGVVPAVNYPENFVEVHPRRKYFMPKKLSMN